MSELESVINDLKIMANPTDEEMECLPEISGFEAEIILKEIERLNNIINELEKALKSHKDLKVMVHYGEYYVEIEEVYNYLQELKGVDKE